MFVDDNEKETLKVMGGETQKVELTSETFQDDVFDHYLVVKNPTVSNPSYFHKFDIFQFEYFSRKNYF